MPMVINKRNDIHSRAIVCQVGARRSDIGVAVLLGRTPEGTCSSDSSSDKSMTCIRSFLVFAIKKPPSTELDDPQRAIPLNDWDRRVDIAPWSSWWLHPLPFAPPTRLCGRARHANSR